MAGLNTGEIRIAGTGRIYKAPLGTAVPTDSLTAWGAAFRDLGYASDGFVATPNLKTLLIHGWQKLTPLRQVTTEFDYKFEFELLQTNKDTLALAWGGASVALNPPTLGTVVIAATTGVLTVSAPETLAVNDPIQLGAITGTDGSFVAGTTYYVKTIPTSTTLTVSATVGGAAIVSASSGSSASIAKVTGAYSLALPTDPSTGFVLGIDWSDGATNGRLVIPNAVLTALPTVKAGRNDAIKYAFGIQALTPADGSAPVVPYGIDTAIGS